jgi:hypothetical protein
MHNLKSKFQSLTPLLLLGILEQKMKRLKRLMPLLLYGTKKNADNSFFKRVAMERHEAIKMGSST